MTTCTVGFKVSDSIYSVNMIWSNTGEGELDSIKEAAEKIAAKRGYTVAYIRQITEAEETVNARKGMPLYMIDEETERKYDPSFKVCPY